MRNKRLRKAVVAGRPCFYCGAPAVEADHRIPTSRGGREVESNLVPSCLRCNRSKGNRAAPRPQRAIGSVFSTPRNHTPAYVRFSLPMRRYGTIRGDFSAERAGE